MDVPEELLGPVSAAGEEVRAALQTRAMRASVGRDGVEQRSPIWAVATARRLWLLADEATGRWAAATGDPRAVRLEPGWTQDVLRFGERRLPLRRRDRDLAEVLIEAFVTGGGGGAPVPAPTVVPPGRAPVARGADSVPDWLAESVVAGSRERWLHAARTRTAQPFHLADSRIKRTPVYLASTDRRTVLAAHLDGAPTFDGSPTWWELVGTDLHVTDGEVKAGSRPLEAVADPAAAVAIAQATNAQDRWTAAAEAAFAASRPLHALRLLAEAHELGHDAGWALIARLLAAVGAPVGAVAAARRALLASDVPVDWLDDDARDARTLARQQVDEETLRRVLAGPLDDLERPSAPDGLPWPPDGQLEVWAAALTLAGRTAEALALWPRAPAGERRHRAVAALLQRDDPPGAAEAWERAALEQRPEQPAAAARTLERALELDPTVAHRLWLRGRWALEDGAQDVADRYWAAALDVDPEGAALAELTPEIARAVATVADRQGESEAAVSFLREAVKLAPDHRPGYLDLARLLGDDLATPTEAAEALEAYLALPPVEGETDGPVLLQLARLRMEAGDRDAAADAVRKAVATDFLHPGIWTQARRLGRSLDLDTAWWRHVEAVLTGAPGLYREPVGRSPAPRLSRAALDALHPGGMGLVDRLRHTMAAPEPPPRRDLVRGLDRVSSAHHPDVQSLIDDLSARLGLDPPAAYLFRGDGAYGCSAWNTDPPVLLIGADHLEGGPRALPRAALGYLVAVELAHLACDHPVLTFDTDVVGTSRSVYRAFGSLAGRAEDVVDVITLIPGVDQLAKLQRVLVLSRKLFAARSALDKVSGLATSVLDWLGLDTSMPDAGVGREGLRGAALAFRMQADRAALLLIGDLSAAVQAILASSSKLREHAATVREEGLAELLETSGEPGLGVMLRLAALVEFAAGLGPDGEVSEFPRSAESPLPGPE